MQCESEDQNFIENELLFQNSKTQIYSYPGAVPLHVTFLLGKIKVRFLDLHHGNTWKFTLEWRVC